MGRLGKAAETRREKIKHPEPRFLVTEGIEQFWVHCPLCKLQNAGWDNEGNPQFRGGWVIGEVPTPSGAMEVMGFTCWCDYGKQLRETHGARCFTEAPPETQWWTKPPAILYDALSGGKRPPEPKVSPEAERYLKSIWKQVARVLRGELDMKAFRANAETLMSRYLPEPKACPSIDTILGSDALRVLYQPRSMQIPPRPELPLPRGLHPNDGGA